MMSWLRTLLKVGSRTRKLVGSDLAGNQYFEQLVEGGKAKEVTLSVSDDHDVFEQIKSYGYLSFNIIFQGDPEEVLK